MKKTVWILLLIVGVSLGHFVSARARQSENTVKTDGSQTALPKAIDEKDSVYYRDGFKFVEFDNGKSCFFYPNDEKNQEPLLCKSTEQMRREYRDRKMM